MIPLLSKAELTRSEIQILIDFLLNKQQDTITVNHSEWCEGRSDVLLKLKKQLSEKENSVIELQDGFNAVQNKLRELRSENNIERIQLTTTIKQHLEELNQKNLEIKNLSNENQFLIDKFSNEKQTLSLQLQQLQQKLLQEKQKPNTQELLQQLTENNQSLSNDNKNLKNKLDTISEESFKKLKDYQTKLAEYEQLLQQNTDRISYLDGENFSLKNLQTDVHKLRTELQTRNEEYEKYYRTKEYEVEKLKQQLQEQIKLNSLLTNEDNNKVEIRNLQNALDSINKELNEHKNLVDELNLQLKNKNLENVDFKNQLIDSNNLVSNYKLTLTDKDSKVTYLEQQIRSFANKEDELFKQIEEHKGKNNVSKFLSSFLINIFLRLFRLISPT